MSEQYYNFVKRAPKSNVQKPITWQESAKIAEDEPEFWDFPDPF